jgi:hypothetical protein
MSLPSRGPFGKLRGSGERVPRHVAGKHRRGLERAHRTPWPCCFHNPPTTSAAMAPKPQREGRADRRRGVPGSRPLYRVIRVFLEENCHDTLAFCVQGGILPTWWRTRAEEEVGSPGVPRQSALAKRPAGAGRGASMPARSPRPGGFAHARCSAPARRQGCLARRRLTDSHSYWHDCSRRLRSVVGFAARSAFLWGRYERWIVKGGLH